MKFPDHAMIAAAGLGTRMRPLTNHRPKALVELAGKTLLDHQLDRLDASGVKTAVVNVHHFADQIEAHLQARQSGPQIKVSDERDLLLETGGGLVRAARMLGSDPFFVMNVDGLWCGHQDALQDLANTLAKTPAAKAVLLLARAERTIGLDSAGDFALAADGLLRRRRSRETTPWYYSGVQIFDPVLLDGFCEERFSTNMIWDKALAEGALFGLELAGAWMHVGDPAALREAGQKLTGMAP